MDISWGAIGKILLAGIATYVLLPAVLIIRDAVLWKLINKFILTSKLQLEIRRYVELIHDWNTKYAGEACISSTDKGTKYTINSREVTAEQFYRNDEKSRELKDELWPLELKLHRKAKFLKWLLKHYQQEAIDPINEWKESEEKRLVGKSRHEVSS